MAKKEKIEVKNLKPGMYVSELDRPWLGSPFLFQGFPIRNDEDIKRVASYCTYVYIDTEQGFNPRLEAASVQELPVEPMTGRNGLPYLNSVEDELQVAARVIERTTKAVNKLLEDVRTGSSIQGSEVRRTISQMVSSITRNPDALILLASLGDKDEHATLHALSTTVLSLAFGRHLGMDEPLLIELGVGALLHDVGELSIPSEILDKGNRLNPEELKVMKTHTDIGADILFRAHDIPASSVEVARSHHERQDGSGYPQGIEGNEIPGFARIVAIVDVYDTVTRPRSGRGLSSVDALKHMYNLRGELFDADLVEEFIRCIGIYPVGSVVELSGGQVGVVISAEPDQRLMPKIMLVRDEAKRPYYPPRIVNLAQFSAGRAKPPMEIRRVLDPSAYGIDIRNYVLREVPLQGVRLHRP